MLCSEAEALDGGEDIVCELGPAKWLGVGILGVDECADVGLELCGGAMDAAPDLFFGEIGEEALDLIDPGCAGGRDVDVSARALGEPVADRLGFVGGVVVHHQVHGQVGGHGRLDLIEEPAELA